MPEKPTKPRAKAVALDYKPVDDAPKIVASGQGALADRIVAKAFESGVAVREDPELVDILAAYDIGSFIPAEAFVAVAEILHYLYLANRSLTAKQPDFPHRAYPTPPQPPRTSSTERRG